MSDPLDFIRQPHPDWPRTRPAQTPLSRALRRLAQGKRLTSLDVRILEDAADELDELTARVRGAAAVRQVDIAERIARHAHAGQTEQSTGGDFMRHVERVVALVDGDDAKAVAWLHDVLEDTDVTEGELARAGVSQTVIDAVRVVSRGVNHDGRTYAEYIEGIRRTANPLALAVKIADLRDHLRDQSSEAIVPEWPQKMARLRPRYEKALAQLTGAATKPRGI